MTNTAEHHDKAAQHHEQAAQHHRKASEHHKAGDAEKATRPLAEPFS